MKAVMIMVTLTALLIYGCDPTGPVCDQGDLSAESALVVSDLEKSESQTKLCRECGKKMIRIGTNFVLTSYPAVYPMQWWCACGHTEDAGVDVGTTIEEYRSELWKSIQEEASDE